MANMAKNEQAMIDDIATAISTREKNQNELFLAHKEMRIMQQEIIASQHEIITSQLEMQKGMLQMQEKSDADSEHMRVLRMCQTPQILVCSTAFLIYYTPFTFIFSKNMS